LNVVLALVAVIPAVLISLPMALLVKRLLERARWGPLGFWRGIAKAFDDEAHTAYGLFVLLWMLIYGLLLEWGSHR